MKMFYVQNKVTPIPMLFIKAADQPAARETYAMGFETGTESQYVDATFTEVTDLETLIDLLPTEFIATTDVSF